jgi:hypothetical protein
MASCWDYTLWLHMKCVGASGTGKQQQQTFKFVKFSSMKISTISCGGNFQWVHVTLAKFKYTSSILYF